MRQFSISTFLGDSFSVVLGNQAISDPETLWTALRHHHEASLVPETKIEAEITSGSIQAATEKFISEGGTIRQLRITERRGTTGDPLYDAVGRGLKSQMRRKAYEALSQSERDRRIRAIMTGGGNDLAAKILQEAREAILPPATAPATLSLEDLGL